MRKELSVTFISSGYMILQSGSISMFVKVSVLSLLPPPSSSFFFIFNIQFFIFKIQFSSFDSAPAFKVFVVVVIFILSTKNCAAFWQGDIVQAKYARWNNDGNLKMGEVKTDGTRGLLLSSPRHEWPA